MASARFYRADRDAAILMLRTWAVYERSRRVAIFLIVWAVLTWTPMTAILIVFLSSLRCKYIYSAMHDLYQAHSSKMAPFQTA